MFQNWLRPVDPEAILKNKKLAKYQFGDAIQLFTDGQSTLKQTKIAIIGIGDVDADAVRASLYQLSFPFKGLLLADLGNVRKKDPSFLIPLMMELLDSQICPIIIGNDPKHILTQYKGIQSLEHLISTVLIDERPRFDLRDSDPDPFFFNEILKYKRFRLFHLGLIGCQAHFLNPATLKMLEKRNFECVRLGNARSNLNELEPIIRDGDLLSFNLAALKHTEAPGQNQSTPSGFSLEEACQISRYAGLSDKLKSFGVFGFKKKLDQKNQTAQAVAQMIWYFIDGFCQRKNDFPVSTDGLIEYIVEFKSLEYQLTFWKSTKSGRWWMQVPVTSKEKYQRHRLVPCSYNDYKLASQDELPERLLNALKRF